MATPQRTSGAAWASVMAEAKPLMSSSAGAWGSIERRRTLPGTSTPARRLTRAEITCVPPISSAPTSSRASGMARPVTALTPSQPAPAWAPGLHVVGANCGRYDGRLGIGQSAQDAAVGDDRDAGAFDHVGDVEPARSVFTDLGIGLQLETPYFDEHPRKLTQDLFTPTH